MKLATDEAAGALHLQLVDVPVVQSEEVAPGVIVDFDASDQVVGIELLYLAKRPQPVNLRDLQLHVTLRKPAATQPHHSR